MAHDIATSGRRPSAAPDAFAGSTHTLSIQVCNQPGVLMRICQIFARRGYNIDSLVVSNGRDARFSRITIGLSGSRDGLEQIVKQVNKLIDVINCSEHSLQDSVTREMVLVKLLTGPGERTEILQVVEHFGGKTIDLTESSMIVLIAGNSEKVDAAVRMLGKFEIIETVRTGKVVMARGEGPT